MIQRRVEGEIEERQDRVRGEIKEEERGGRGRDWREH